MKNKIKLIPIIFVVLIGSLISKVFCQTGEAIQLSPSCAINTGKMSVSVTVSQIT